MTSAIARAAGAEIIDLGIVADDKQALLAAVRDALARDIDVLVTLGGASVGDFDLVQPVLGDSADPRFKEVARIATCDAQGNFRFAGIPRARWYIFSRVRWSVGDYGQQGGELLGEVDTTGGGEQQVLLTDSNRL